MEKVSLFENVVKSSQHSCDKSWSVVNSDSVLNIVRIVYMIYSMLHVDYTEFCTLIIMRILYIDIARKKYGKLWL